MPDFAILEIFGPGDPIWPGLTGAKIPDRNFEKFKNPDLPNFRSMVAYVVEKYSPGRAILKLF